MRLLFVLIMTLAFPGLFSHDDLGLFAKESDVAMKQTQFTVFQRTTTPIPGLNNKVLLTIDDITRGQVMGNIAGEDGTPIIATRSLRENDVIKFVSEGKAYCLTLKKLKNHLIRNDSAIFQLDYQPAEKVEEKSTDSSADAKIETLINSLKAISGARFIRNGQEYPVNEAMAHFRSKWQWKKSEIKTPQDFIDLLGSKSSTTGKPYLIKMPDGRIIETEEWFKKSLDSTKP